MAQATMKFSIRYSTHLPALMRALEVTTGDVLELGAGIFSTPVLHWLCKRAKRRLVSMDNDPRFYAWAEGFRSPLHELVYVDDWAEADIEQPWGVALVDHSPSDRRIEEIKRLQQLATVLVVHDTNGRWNKAYHYDKIWDLFTYKYTFTQVEPSTSLLSNILDVTKIMKGIYE